MTSRALEVVVQGFRWALVAIVALISFLPSPGLAASPSRYFAATGHWVGGDFLSFFDQKGGLDVFGYPRTEVIVSQGRLVQYFQRARLESWPENSPPYNVQLMLIGDAVMGPGDPPLTPSQIPAPGDPGQTYFPQTGHTLSGAFRDFFHSHGDLTIFGYPTSEAYQGPSGFLIQRFQRARFELHAELPAAYQVSVGLLGDQYIFNLAMVPFGLTTPVSDASPPVGPSSSTTLVASGGQFIYQTKPGGDLTVANLDGSGATVVGQGYDPAWSADGTQIVYADRGANPGIVVAKADGLGAKTVWVGPDARSPQFSPDGSQIAFYHMIIGWGPTPSGVGFQDWFQIIVVRLKDGSTYLPPDQPEHAYSPSWSPDGKLLVFAGDGGLYVGSELMSAKAIPNTSFLDSTPSWSPQGDRIVFTALNHDHWDIGMINVDGSGLNFLTSGGSAAGAPYSSAAGVWSPSGDQIAFASDRAGGWNLYIMNSDGSNVSPAGTIAVSYTGSYDHVVSWKK